MESGVGVGDPCGSLCLGYYDSPRAAGMTLVRTHCRKPWTLATLMLGTYLMTRSFHVSSFLSDKSRRSLLSDSWLTIDISIAK